VRVAPWNGGPPIPGPERSRIVAKYYYNRQFRTSPGIPVVTSSSFSHPLRLSHRFARLVARWNGRPEPFDRALISPVTTCPSRFRDDYPPVCFAIPRPRLLLVFLFATTHLVFLFVRSPRQCIEMSLTAGNPSDSEQPTPIPRVHHLSNSVHGSHTSAAVPLRVVKPAGQTRIEGVCAFPSRCSPSIHCRTWTFHKT
jgi:hypothetical protein